MLHCGFVGGPFTRHEDEAEELEPRAEDRDPFKAVFEHDVDVACDVGHVRGEPEVGPVGVDLVIGDYDGALVEIAFDVAIALVQLVADGSVARDFDGGGAPPIGHADD